MDEELTQRYVEYQQLMGAEISLEVTELIQRLCNEAHPKLIIDLGSGWSSFVFRRLAPGATIWSVDTDKPWLDKTIAFCNAHGVSDDNHFMMYEDFEKMLPTLEGQANIVLHDMGNRLVRMEKLPTALSLVAPNGVIVLDDMHKEDLSTQTRRMINRTPDFTIIDERPTTLDVIGRFAWIAKRAALP